MHKPYHFFPEEIDKSLLVYDKSYAPVPFYTYQTTRYHNVWDAVCIILDNRWTIQPTNLPYTVIAVTKEGLPHGYINVVSFDESFSLWRFPVAFSTMPGFVHEEPFAYVPKRFKQITKSMLQLYSSLFEQI